MLRSDGYIDSRPPRIHLPPGQTFHFERDAAPARKITYTLGLDLGQSIDPTAISIIEKSVSPTGKWHDDGWSILQTLYDVRHLERLRLQTSYPDVVSQVHLMLETAPLRGNCKLVIDQTGVGRPVCDMFKAAHLKFEAVTITAGDAESRHHDGWRVSKLLLVSRLQALVHSQQLRIGKGIPECEALKSELQDFRVSFTEGTGTTRFGARQGKHDDLVLATAIAAWWAARPSYSGTARAIGLV